MSTEVLEVNVESDLTGDAKAVLDDLIVLEKDLGYYKQQNVLSSCTRDGCTRISYCSCDCNDGW